MWNWRLKGYAVTQVKYFAMIKIHSLNTKVVVTWKPVDWFALKLKTYKKNPLIFWSFQNIFRVYRKKPTSKHSSWRRLTSLSSEDVFKTSSRRLEQDEYVCLSLTSTEDVFKTSSKRLQDVLQKCLQDVLKTSSRHAKIFSRRFQDVSST